MIFAIYSFNNKFHPNLINFQFLAQGAVLENVSLKRYTTRDFPGGAVVKNLPANAGDMGSRRSHMPRSN